MRVCDTLRLVKNEFRYGKVEWITSMVLQILILSCTFFVVSLEIDLGGMGEEYLRKLYPDGYEFSLSGYTEEDREELVSMGFYDLNLYEGGGSGILDGIRGIWLSKIKAVMDGKDIWNQDIDEFVIMLGTFQIIFGILSLLLIFVMLNNLSNSFHMKILRREQYITMMSRLGCRRKELRRIFYIFFSIRNLFSLLVSGCINIGIMSVFNKHIGDLLEIRSGVRTIRITEGIVLFLFVECMMRIRFRKIWGESNEHD